MDGKILSGKVALVAGGSGGIGSAVAVALADWSPAAAAASGAPWP